MTYDLAILGDPNDSAPDLSVNNTAADGIYKLMQRVMLLLLTESSNQFTPTGVGTDLVENVISANTGDIDEIQAFFNIAASKVADTIKAQTAQDVPDDEKLKRITTIVSEGAAEDALVAEVEIVALSGATTEVKFPISNLLTGT